MNALILLRIETIKMTTHRFNNNLYNFIDTHCLYTYKKSFKIK